MIGYALLLWPVTFLILYLLVVRKDITPDGQFVESRDCVAAEEPIYDSRGPSGGGCLEYGETYYVPIGPLLERTLRSSGYMTVGYVLMFGGFAMFEKRKQERAELRTEAMRVQRLATQQKAFATCKRCGQKNKFPLASRFANCGKCGEGLDLALEASEYGRA